jgi:hypothetical protein
MIVPNEIDLGTVSAGSAKEFSFKETDDKKSIIYVEPLCVCIFAAAEGNTVSGSMRVRRNNFTKESSIKIVTIDEEDNLESTVVKLKLTTI